jgi:hypothetical protein
MISYSDNGRSRPAFRVSYRFLRPDEGGLSRPPRQHVRWDFLYAGDHVQSDGLSMIWPEFVGVDGSALPQGEVPMTGLADMFIVDDARVPYHRERIRIGTRGYFMEGPRRVAECEVVAMSPYVMQSNNSLQADRDR